MIIFYSGAREDEIVFPRPAWQRPPNIMFACHLIEVRGKQAFEIIARKRADFLQRQQLARLDKA